MYNNLNAEIGRKGLLKKEIAAKLNISPSALRMKLSGEKRFFIDEAFKLSELLGGHSVEYLFSKEVSKWKRRSE